MKYFSYVTETYLGVDKANKKLFSDNKLIKNLYDSDTGTLPLRQK